MYSLGGSSLLPRQFLIIPPWASFVIITALSPSLLSPLFYTGNSRKGKNHSDACGVYCLIIFPFFAAITKWLACWTPYRAVQGTVLFFGETLYSQSAPLHPGLITVSVSDNRVKLGRSNINR